MQWLCAEVVCSGCVQRLCAEGCGSLQWLGARVVCSGWVRRWCAVAVYGGLRRGSVLTTAELLLLLLQKVRVFLSKPACVPVQACLRACPSLPACLLCGALRPSGAGAAAPTP